MTTDYLKQKGFSENGEVKMSFQDLAKLLEDYRQFDPKIIITKNSKSGITDSEYKRVIKHL